MNVKEIREKETSQLLQELTEKRRHLFDLRAQAVTEKLENPTQLGKTRKEIARIKTILREREIQAEKGAAAAAARSAPAAQSANAETPAPAAT